MGQTIEAWFDGDVFRPEEPVTLTPNTRVRITLEAVGTEEEQPISFLRVARDLKLDGPPDWSANVDQYLYGKLHTDEPSWC
jgi:hypothetical protein